MVKNNKTLLFVCLALFASIAFTGCASGEGEAAPADETVAAPANGEAAGAGAAVGTSEGMEVPEDAK